MRSLLVITILLTVLAVLPAQAQAPQKPQLAEEVFKNIQLLKGLPVDEFMDVMGFFSASTNPNASQK